MIFIENEKNGLDENEIREQLIAAVSDLSLKKVLLVPPDITRLNSGAGIITAELYDILENVHVDILPALGTHKPMTREEEIKFFGKDIPDDRFLVHNWRRGVTKIGEIPAQFVSSVSDGLMNESIDIEVSDYLLDPSYDLIISIGQVVPHEVVGMANYTKNIVVGCGGSSFINASHMLGALYGMERIMGKDHSPVRKVFDYAQENFISKMNVLYVLTVTVTENEKTDILGLYIDKGREGFEKAVKLSQKRNIIRVEKPIDMCIVWLDDAEYHSMWVGNKAIYRTRMAMADGGKLIIIAPGVNMFGEDEENDRLIRKYGYAGRDKVLELCKENKELQDNLSVAAHLIHGSTEGRFEVTYAPVELNWKEVGAVGYGFVALSTAMNRYHPPRLKPGFNKLPDGKEVYFIENPALGLWML
ncbi:MAG: lactate racemase domain-containing protein [Oscillospiraceae bacterium]|nr:lactate racemase domain-containing protein [Oscillospiraceae bacterium]